MKKLLLIAPITCAAIAATVCLAQERRAKPRSFGLAEFRDVFPDEVLTSRPTVMELRGLKPQVMLGGAPGAATSGGGAAAADSGGGGTWSKLASADSIVGEVKRIKLLFDGIVAQPGPFKSGGYRKARLNLSIMATLFNIISQYDGEVRFKKDAEAARNLLARTYGDCNSGSIQIFNQCKARKQDLDDMLNGSSISSNPAKPETEWPNIADRSLMMQYLEVLSKEELPNLTNDDKGMKEDPDAIRQFGDMVAIVGSVLIQEGMDEADDEEYAALAQRMIDAAVQIAPAVERGDADAARKAVGAINQSCEACHEQYR